MSAMKERPEPESCVLVIFGASGDLTSRKLIPALYEMNQRGLLPKGLRVLGVSRTELSDDAYRDRLTPKAAEHAHSYEQSSWAEFAKRIHYHAADASEAGSIDGIHQRVRTLGDEGGISRSGGEPNTLFYLSVSPNLYEPIIDAIGASGWVAEGKRWCSLHPEQTAWQRIVVEKPFGHDVASAESLNRALGRVFEEDSVFRIDHYLGKELVQNILVMRFANAIFEPVWNSQSIQHVQVTAAESIGVGSRAGGFYDGAGAVRDMIQSHLLQVVAMVAMEPPSGYEGDAIMREKIRLFKTARLAHSAGGQPCAVLGRYGQGPDGPAYVDEQGVDPNKRTETYGAIQIGFDTWRWAGVPFFIRSGKRMASKVTEVVVQFKNPPVNLFGLPEDQMGASNRLVLAIAPNEELRLELRGKVPGLAFKIDSAALDLDYLKHFGGEAVEAYGPLLVDAMQGDRTLYKHRDEVELGWKLVQPVLDSEQVRGAIETYEPGSWGPKAADGMIASAINGGAWHNRA